MSRIIFALSLLLVSQMSATDRFVDPNLSQGNGTTLFTTIGSAVAAAVNGDRIIVTASTYNEPQLILNKSLEIIPLAAGSARLCSCR